MGLRLRRRGTDGELAVGRRRIEVSGAAAYAGLTVGLTAGLTVGVAWSSPLDWGRVLTKVSTWVGIPSETGWLSSVELLVEELKA